MNALNQRGLILITSMFLVLLVSSLAIGYLSLVNNQLEMAGSAITSEKAFYCADTGVSEVIIYLKNIPDWSGLNIGQTLVEGDFNNGHYTVTADKKGTVNTIVIKSVGTMSNFQRILRVGLLRDQGRINQQDWVEI